MNDLTALLAECAEIEALRAKATKGPWDLYRGRDGTLQINGATQDLGGNPSVVHWSGFDACDLSVKRRWGNAAYIAASHRQTDLIAKLRAHITAAAPQAQEPDEWRADMKSHLIRADYCVRALNSPGMALDSINEALAMLSSTPSQGAQSVPEWLPIESCPYGVEVMLWREGTTPEQGYWPGTLRHSDKQFPPTHWAHCIKAPQSAPTKPENQDE